MFAGEPMIPSDAEVVAATELVLAAYPELGRLKVLAQLKSENNWSLSDARLKKLLAAHRALPQEQAVASSSGGSSGSNVIREDDPSLPLPYLPTNALQAQQDYAESSTRIYKVYGRRYDYGVSPNADQGVMFMLCQERIKKMQGTSAMPQTPEAMESACRSRTVRPIWRMYKNAARIAGVSLEDVGRQFYAEYGLDALAYDETDAPEVIALRKRRFKETKLKMMAEIDRNHPGKIKKDRQGKIIYDEKVHGEDVLILVRIDKATGREIEPVNSTREKASMQ